MPDYESAGIEKHHQSDDLKAVLSAARKLRNRQTAAYRRLKNGNTRRTLKGKKRKFVRGATSGASDGLGDRANGAADIPAAGPENADYDG